jgi:hypothetical protein
MTIQIQKMICFLCFSLIIGAEVDSSFSVKWTDLPWGAGGLHPDGPPWNMVGPYDFDNDGYGDFIVTSSYTGSFCNGVYHFEAVANDSIALQWYYYFGDLSCTYDNYSSVTVGDIDGDSIPEIIVLADTEPGVSGGHGLQIFEWNTDSLLFPYMPTTTWDMGLDSVWEAGQIIAAELDGDANQEVVVSIMNGPWGTTGSSHFMIFELENSDLDSPSWHIEYTDPITTNWSGYNIYVNDLDQDGLMEIYTVAYEYYRLIIYENIGSEDLYAYQTDFYVSNELNERANQSIVMANFNDDNTNELYAVTSGTNSLTGELLTPGYFYGIEGSSDVSNITFSNFHYFNHYQGGLRQIITGDADMDGNPNLYLAGHYNEAVYDWEYVGDNPLSDSSFVEHMIFLDDTTDDFTSGTDQGKVRVAKLFSGDIDNDNQGDIVFTSAGLGSDKPHIYFLEHDGSSGLTATIIVNEFLASNETCCGSEIFGSGEDFVELYNYGTAPINIEGWGFSDSEGSIATTAPDTTIPPGGFLIIWYTGETNGFPEIDAELSSGGETVYGEDSSGTMVFSVSFDAQDEDVSYGRYPDGSDTWQQMNPTPGSTNTNLLSNDNSFYSAPEYFSLGQNYPNPFNPQTQFHYDLPKSGNINLGIYDVLGKEVYTVLNGYQRAGKHNVLWTGINNKGLQVQSGIYFYRLTTDSEITTKKMVYTK